MYKISIFRAFKHAFEGIASFIRTERNAKIHAFCTVGVVFFSIYLTLTSTEWLFILSAISAVWITEMLNSAIEKLCDLYSKEYHPAIKIIKDIAAGAVLIAALYALVVGSVILIPKMI